MAVCMHACMYVCKDTHTWDAGTVGGGGGPFPGVSVAMGNPHLLLLMHSEPSYSQNPQSRAFFRPPSSLVLGLRNNGRYLAENQVGRPMPRPVGHPLPRRHVGILANLSAPKPLRIQQKLALQPLTSRMGSRMLFPCGFEGPQFRPYSCQCFYLGRSVGVGVQGIFASMERLRG